MSTKVVYVTGCLGFIGSHVTRACLQRGWYVMGVDKCTYAANTNVLWEFNDYENFEFVNEDINDLKFFITNFIFTNSLLSPNPERHWPERYTRPLRR